MSTKAYIALGSNIEPKAGHLKQAIESIEQLDSTVVDEISNVYQTVPVGYADQDDFLNMVISVTTTNSSEAFLKELQAIEAELKRVRTIKNGPRTIDLDILKFGDQTINTEDLIVPHPRLHERAFVLFPFAEVGEKESIPTLDKTVSQLRDELPQAEKNDVEILNQLKNLV